MTTTTFAASTLPADWRDFVALTKPRVMSLVVFTDPFIKEVGLVRRGMLVATDQGVFAAPGKNVGKKHPMHLHAPPPGEIEPPWASRRCSWPTARRLR